MYDIVAVGMHLTTIANLVPYKKCAAEKSDISRLLTNQHAFPLFSLVHNDTSEILN